MDTVAFIGISSTKSGYFVDTVEFIGMPSTKSGCFVDMVEFIGMPSTKYPLFGDESQDLGLPAGDEDRISTMASATDCDAPEPPSSWRISA